jgi:hypothetical protein
MKAIAIAAAALCAAVLAVPTQAQDKGPIRAQKRLLDNDKVRVTEGVFKPGEMNPMEARGYRITRVLKGNTTIERTHKDGKKEKIEWKEGAIYQSGPDNASSKNVGKGEVTIYTVTLKQAK